MEIGNSRLTNDLDEKESILTDFKDTVAEFNAEFEDDGQKVSKLCKYNTEHKNECGPNCSYIICTQTFDLCVSVQDAHEFLSCVLNQMRSPSPYMDLTADETGIGYTCPVDAHIMFETLNIRSCKG